MLLFFTHGKQDLLYFSCNENKSNLPSFFIPHGIEHSNKYLHFQGIVLKLDIPFHRHYKTNIFNTHTHAHTHTHNS